MMTPREFATNVVTTLRQAGHEALFAGGCVRDQFFGLEPDDYDVATSAHPNQVQKLFPRSIAVGAAFGVIEVLGHKPHKVQVATFRSDGPYSDARRPDHVTYSSAKEDAERRDFTINGMFFDPLDGRLIDYVGGEDDLKAKKLRAIGDPMARFREDRLRMLRAVRFAARFSLAIESATWAAAKSMAAEVVSVSGERIAEELRKLLAHPSRATGARMLVESGLMRAVIPELNQVNFDALSQLTTAAFPLAFAVLLANVPDSCVERIAERLRLANAERDHVRWLLRHQHRLADAHKLPMHELKPLLAHAGIADLLSMHRVFGSAGDADWCAARLQEWPRERIDPKPLLTGDDLVALGMKPGPNFKLLLDRVRDAQLDEQINTREAAVKLVQS